MAKLLKLRRGTTTQHASFTGAEGEVTIDTTKDTAVVHDGSTQGGTPLAKENMSNVSSASIAGRLGTGSIQGTQLENSGVTAGQYGSSSAIPIVTVDAQGLVTAASTTAVDSTKIQNGTTEVATASSGDITMKRSGTTRVVVGNAGAAITGNLDVSAGVDVTGGNITLPDAGEVRLGDSGDLQIYHDSNGSYINDAGTGPLRIMADTLSIRNTANTQDRLTVASADGQVNIPGNLDVGAGIDVTGAIIGDRASFKDDGTAGPTVQIMTDDNNPWALAIGNDTYSTSDHKGLMYYQNNDGTMYQHYRGVGTFEPIYFQTSDATTTNNFMYVDTNRAVHLEYQDGTRLSTTNTGVTVSGTVTADGISFIPSGTKMLFAQTSAPTGWTKVTTHNNKALRVVSGTAGSGGSNAFTTAFGAARGISANASNTTQGGNVSVSVANSTQGGNISVGNTTAGGNLSIGNTSTSGTVNSHTLSTSQMPSHGHNIAAVGSAYRNQWRGGSPAGLTTGAKGQTNTGTAGNTTSNYTSSSVGGGQGHSHGFSGGSHNHNGSLSGTAHNHNANFSGSAHNHNASGSFSGSAHNHSISVGNLDMAVQYVDVIIASKD